MVHWPSLVLSKGLLFHIVHSSAATRCVTSPLGSCFEQAVNGNIFIVLRTSISRLSKISYFLENDERDMCLRVSEVLLPEYPHYWRRSTICKSGGTPHFNLVRMNTLLVPLLSFVIWLKLELSLYTISR